MWRSLACGTSTAKWSLRRLKLGVRARPPVEPAPGSQVLPEHLLSSLCRQLRQPLPTGQWIRSCSAKLTVHLSDRGPPRDAAVAARVPLVEQVPQRPRGVSLLLQLRCLGGDGIESGGMNPATYVLHVG